MDRRRGYLIDVRRISAIDPTPLISGVIVADEPPTLKLRVTGAMPQDVGRGFVRLDPADIVRLRVGTREFVEVVGKRSTVGKVMPVSQEHRGLQRIQIDGITRQNAGTAPDQIVEVRKVDCPRAQKVTLSPESTHLRQSDIDYIATLIDGLPITVGDRVHVPLFGGGSSADFEVMRTLPDGPVVVGSSTRLELTRSSNSKEATESRPKLSYEDVGGLKREVARIREIIELPLRYPEVFERLGIDAPKGVLLYGPTGCGKTLIARAVAHETSAQFFAINGPEIIHKFYGESEKHLRSIFDEAAKKAPSIIFLDEIDAIASKRENAIGEVEKRVVSQLLTLMDGLSKRRQVMVIAATNLPNSLDPALRRPGRFDREIAIRIPDQPGRYEILQIHSRGMPLASDVNLEQLAAVTHGFVGADLEALCREAAMNGLRRLLPEIDFAASKIPWDQLAKLDVQMGDFRAAKLEIEPSAIREVFVEVPQVKWEEVGGLNEVKRQLIEAVEWPLRYPDLFRRMAMKPPRGVLLSGPPGCGKTLLAKAAATQLEVNFIAIKGPELLSKYVGESERGVRELFRKARQASPCIVFFDEIDAMVPARGRGDSVVTDRVIGQFLTELDGLEELNGVLILGATNRRDILDPALLRPGRFDLIIEIPLPNERGRREIFAMNLRGKLLDNDVSLDELAAKSEGFSGAEVQGVCHRAMFDAIRETVAKLDGQPFREEMLQPISRESLERAMRAIRT